MKEYKKEYRGFKIGGKKSRCWIGTSKNVDELGYIHVYAGTHDGENVFHRYMWVKHKGSIPRGYDLHHRCEVEGCGRPKHLELVRHDKHRLKHVKLSPEEIKEAIKLYKKLWSLSELGKKFDMSFAGIRVMLIREKVYKHNRVPRTYLSEEDKAKIIKLYTGGLTNTYELGRRFGKTGEAVSYMLVREGIRKKGTGRVN